ncbi:two component transcriptional regulator, LytTR family [Oscillospiraceae bacterium]|nr:two component transcriptional regulator, LytTR family [Oscillospiraceae bacterium]
MKIAICDDEKTFLKELEEKIYKIIPRLDCDVEPFSCGEDLLSSSMAFDIIFLDIEMQGMDGMSCARKIRQTDKNIPIVFLTSHTEMAVEGYEVSAFRFLQKPVDDTKLQNTLQDLIRIKIQSRSVIVKYEGEEVVVVPSEVLFIESDNNNVRIKTVSGTCSTRMKITDAIELLNGPCDTIRRVHRCTAVNLQHVSRIRDREAVLDDGSVIGISRSYYQDFKNELYEYVRKSAR